MSDNKVENKLYSLIKYILYIVTVKPCSKLQSHLHNYHFLDSNLTSQSGFLRGV